MKFSFMMSPTQLLIKNKDQELSFWLKSYSNSKYNLFKVQETPNLSKQTFNGVKNYEIWNFIVLTIFIFLDFEKSDLGS